MAAPIAYQIGSFIEEFIDEIYPMSYLDLNRGDKNLIGEIRGKNKKQVVYAAISGAVAVGLNVFAAWIASVMGIGNP